MGFPVKRYFAIWANEQLSEKIENSSFAVAQFELKQNLFSLDSNTHDVSYADSQITEVKLLFIARLRYSSLQSKAYPNLKVQNYGQFVEELIGEPPYQPSVFDKWWEIKRFKSITNFELFQKNVPLEILKELAVDNDPDAAEWLSWLINLREKSQNSEK